MSGKCKEDDKIVELILNSSTREKGFEELVDKYQKTLYYHIKRIVYNHDDTKDIIQNTFIKILQNISSLKNESGLKYWMLKIATNESLSHLRKMKLRNMVSMESESTRLSKLLISEQQLDSDSIQLRFEKAILNLTSKQRLVFNLRYFQEMNYKEIAQIVNLKEGTLRSTYFKTVQKIETYMIINQF